MCLELGLKGWKIMGYRSNPTRHGNSNLTEDDVREVLSMRIYGWSAGKIAKRFGVGKSTIIDIWGGKTWRHITRNPQVEALKEEIRDLKREIAELSINRVANHNPLW